MSNLIDGRAIAILAVVVCHATLWPAPVGSAVMVVLIGFGLARYQVRALERDGIPGFLAPLPLVLAPYFVLVAFHALAWGQMPWASLLLIGNLGLADPIRHTMLPYLYWFVEIYAQLMLLLAVLFLLPGPRRLVLARPFRFALMLLAAAVLARAVNLSAFTWTSTVGSACRFRYQAGGSSAPPFEATIA